MDNDEKKFYEEINNFISCLEKTREKNERYEFLEVFPRKLSGNLSSFVETLRQMLHYCFASGKPRYGIPHISPSCKAFIGREFLKRAVEDCLAEPRNMGGTMNGFGIAKQLGFAMPEKADASESGASPQEIKRINRELNFALIVCSYCGHKAKEKNSHIRHVEGEGFVHDILIY